MQIDGHPIGSAHPPFIVAELGAGHLWTEGSLCAMLQIAKESGADAAKIQVYQPEDLTLPNLPPMAGGAWAGQDLWELYTKNALDDHCIAGLFTYAKKLGITLFASVFSPRSIPLLENLGCPAYKIASLDIEYRELQFRAKATGKPIILSTGCADIDTIHDAYWALDGANVAILHCVSGYPTPLADANLSAIGDLQRRYDSEVIGFSDHTLTDTAAIIAVSHGASIIEKHMAMAGSADSIFGLRPYEFKGFVAKAREAWHAIQRRRRGSAMCEADVAGLKRAIVATRDLEAGEDITVENCKVLRTTMSGPGALSPVILPLLLGEPLARDVKRGHALFREDITLRFEVD